VLASLGPDHVDLEGRVSSELLDVKGKTLADEPTNPKQLGTSPNSTVTAGDFLFRPFRKHKPQLDMLEGVAWCVCEMAIHFRGGEAMAGQGFALEPSHVLSALAADLDVYSHLNP